MAGTAAPTSEQPKPGILIIITFENGTTKAVRSDSTDLRAVQGGYFIADSSVQAAQPLQSKTVSKTVVQQLVSMFVDIRIEDDPLLPPPTSSEGCSEGWGYYVDDPNPICEPLDKIGQGPPPDQAFCAALGCPYNPPNLPPESPIAPEQRGGACAALYTYNPETGQCELPPSPPPSTEEPPAAEPEPEPEPDPEPAPDPGNEDQNEGGSGGDEEGGGNGNGGDGGGDGSDGEGGGGDDDGGEID